MLKKNCTKKEWTEINKERKNVQEEKGRKEGEVEYELFHEGKTKMGKKDNQSLTKNRLIIDKWLIDEWKKMRKDEKKINQKMILKSEI